MKTAIEKPLYAARIVERSHFDPVFDVAVDEDGGLSAVDEKAR